MFNNEEVRLYRKNFPFEILSEKKIYKEGKDFQDQIRSTSQIEKSLGLHDNSPGKPLTLSNYQYKTYFLVEKRNRGIKGFLTIKFLKECITVHSIMIHACFQRKRGGEALMQKMLLKAHKTQQGVALLYRTSSLGLECFFKKFLPNYLEISKRDNQTLSCWNLKSIGRYLFDQPLTFMQEPKFPIPIKCIHTMSKVIRNGFTLGKLASYINKINESVGENSQNLEDLKFYLKNNEFYNWYFFSIPKINQFIAGYAYFNKGENDCYCLQGITVHKILHGQGIGRLLITKVLEKAYAVNRALELEFPASNERLSKFFNNFYPSEAIKSHGKKRYRYDLINIELYLKNN